MPFITTPESCGCIAGLLKGIEVGLQIKFGGEGLKLLPEIRELHDHEKLSVVLQAIKNVSTPAELRQLWLGETASGN